MPINWEIIKSFRPEPEPVSFDRSEFLKGWIKTEDAKSCDIDTLRELTTLFLNENEKINVIKLVIEKQTSVTKFMNVESSELLDDNSANKMGEIIRLIKQLITLPAIPTKIPDVTAEISATTAKISPIISRRNLLLKSKLVNYSSKGSDRPHSNDSEQRSSPETNSRSIRESRSNASFMARSIRNFFSSEQNPEQNTSKLQLTTSVLNVISVLVSQFYPEASIKNIIDIFNDQTITSVLSGRTSIRPGWLNKEAAKIWLEATDEGKNCSVKQLSDLLPNQHKKNRGIKITDAKTKKYENEDFCEIINKFVELRDEKDLPYGDTEEKELFAFIKKEGGRLKEDTRTSLLMPSANKIFAEKTGSSYSLNDSSVSLNELSIDESNQENSDLKKLPECAEKAYLSLGDFIEIIEQNEDEDLRNALARRWVINTKSNPNIIDYNKVEKNEAYNQAMILIANNSNAGNITIDNFDGAEKIEKFFNEAQKIRTDSARPGTSFRPREDKKTNSCYETLTSFLCSCFAKS